MTETGADAAARLRPTAPLPDAKWLVPVRPAPADGLIDAMLRGALHCLKQGDDSAAANLLEAVLERPTRNRWIYHALAHLHLACLKSDQDQPQPVHLEAALRLNFWLPAALERCARHQPELGTRLLAELTGLEGLAFADYVAVMQTGLWKDLVPFRADDDSFRGRSILDFGARTGFHGLAFLAAGAARYAAYDKHSRSFHFDYVKNHMADEHDFTHLGFTMAQLAERHPRRFELICAKKFTPPRRRFDLICLFSVSEHLRRPDKVFRALVPCLARRGRLLISHHNFFCWNGHHGEPRSVAQLHRMQAQGQPTPLADWNFFDAPIDNTELNRLAPARLRTLLVRRYHIRRWETEYTRIGKGLERFHVGIARRHESIDAEDLLTQNILIELEHKPWRRWLYALARVG